MRPILIVSTGHTFDSLRATDGDFTDWIAERLGPGVIAQHVEAADIEAPLPTPTLLAGVVITGSHAMVSDRLPWSERLAGWLAACVDSELPVLGICYGHQLLAHALGGVVTDHPAGIEIGTHDVFLNEQAADDPLFGALPARFPAQLVHRQSVRELPPGATLLAGNDHEPHQAYRVGGCAWGVQFHPEFSAAAMRAYIRHLANDNPDRISAPHAARVTDTPEASSLLARFAVLALATRRKTQSDSQQATQPAGGQASERRIIARAILGARCNPAQP